MGLTTQKNYRVLLYVNSLVIVLLGAAFAGWGVFWLFPAGLGEGYHNVQAAVQQIGKVLFWRVAILYAVTSLLIVLAMVVLHLLYSHRIAGPAYHLSREAAKIAQGELTGNIRFRRKDNLTDMAVYLNKVTSQYRGRINAITDCLTIIEAQSGKASDLIRQDKNEAALEQSAEEIMNNLKKIEHILSEIRTS
jgi:methyl-accepting chemotaxis protein